VKAGRGTIALRAPERQGFYNPFGIRYNEGWFSKRKDGPLRRLGAGRRGHPHGPIRPGQPAYLYLGEMNR